LAGFAECGKLDPEMHQTKKGNEWHFGMRCHIGVDADSGLVHTVVGTAANVHDVTQARALLRGKPRRSVKFLRVWSLQTPPPDDRRLSH
jgi:IS5 family transposase